MTTNTCPMCLQPVQPIDTAYCIGVSLKPEDVLWGIHLKEVEPSDYRPHGGPLLRTFELQWGWDAGMSDDQLKELAEDAPRGCDSVRTTEDSLRELYDEIGKLLGIGKDKQGRADSNS